VTVVTALRANRAAPLVLTCEHAACTVPLEYDGLGIDADELQQHIGWDIGAAPLTRTLAERLDVPAVLAEVACLSNGKEERELNTEHYRESIANYLEAGILNYLSKGEIQHEARRQTEE